MGANVEVVDVNRNNARPVFADTLVMIAVAVEGVPCPWPPKSSSKVILGITPELEVRVKDPPTAIPLLTPIPLTPKA